MLQAKNINKKIKDKEILKDISLTVKRGEIVSIIGPNGAGKTCLIRAISLIDFPDSGSLKIDDVNYQFPIKEPKSLMLPYPELTVVFQQLFVWPHLTIRENLTLPLRGNIDKKLFEKLIELFQMESFLEKYPNEVSQGQRQRTALVRAFLVKPKYFLLDEVTSALDVEQSYILLDYLRSLAKKGVGIIIVSHALNHVRKIADRVLFIENGQIVEEGSNTILTKPKTLRLKKFIGIY